MKKAEVAAPRRVAIYTRKSTSAGLEQEFNSLDAQREACESYARSQGWRVLGTYDDGGFTGANVERPAFQRLLADVDAGKIDVVVVYKVDRLSRSLLDFARVMDRFNTAGAAFVSVTQNFSTADAMGRLTLNMLMSFAEFEREMIAERTRDKIVAARRKGKWTGGRVPIGFTVVDRKLVKNASEALVVQEVFALYESHHSVLDVARELQARGRQRREGAWCKHSVLRVLRNPLYAGLIAGGGELHAAEHQAIVPREQYERVRELLPKPGASSGSVGRNPEYLLRGLLHCGVCRAAMTPGGSRGYRYYRCITRDKRGTRACTSRPLAAGAIERFVVERLRGIAADTCRTEALVERVRRRFEGETRALSAERAALPGRIAGLSAEAQTLVATLGKLSGKVRGVAEARLQGVAGALEQAHGELAALERKLAALQGARADTEWVRHALGEFESLWELMTPVNRQRLVTALVDRVDVRENDGELDLTLASLSEVA